MKYATRCNTTLVTVVLWTISTAWKVPSESAAEDLALLRRTGRAFTEVAKKAIPAVVFIEVEKTIEVPGVLGGFNDPFGFFGDEFFRRFFEGRLPRQRYRQTGQGSGFLISKDGFILTNNHVVGDAERITVKLHNGKVYQARRIGSDPKSEVALIKIEGSDFPYLELGDSSTLEIGEWVIAVGNPFGLTETVTAGVVSAKGRSNIGIAEYEDFIQTDAAINPGNSGGPLLNIEGRVVGINTAIFSRSGGYMGIGFAIPINMAKTIMEQLKRSGHVIRGYLGVLLNPEEVTPDLAESFGLKRAGGALIAQVVPDSPAAKCDLQPGDIVLEVDGKLVPDNASFRNLIAMTKPGTALTLTIFRDGERKTVKVVVGQLPPEPQRAAAGPEDAAGRLGIMVRDLTPDLARQLGYTDAEGVLVDRVDPDGLAAQAGIRPGHLIVSVNRQPVRNAREFWASVGRVEQGSNLLLRIRDPRSAWFVLLRLR